MTTRFSILLLLVLLAACSSSRKDYSDATPLQAINATTKVVALWAKSTGDVPEYAHAQLPVVADEGKRLYAASRDGLVAAYEMSDGQTVWRVNLSEETFIPLATSTEKATAPCRSRIAREPLRRVRTSR